MVGTKHKKSIVVVVKATSAYYAYREALIYSEDARDHMYACNPEDTNLSFYTIMGDTIIRDEHDDMFFMVKESNVKAARDM